MSEKNPKCRLYWDCRTRDMVCENPAVCHPVDMTRIPVCPPEPRQWSTKPPYCGCENEKEACMDWTMPGTVETRLLRPPLRCVKPCCNYGIPAIPCRDPPKSPKPLPRDPLCFDWTVDEPGPNDSYGLNGLNWYDYKMEFYNHQPATNPRKEQTPYHAGLSNLPPPPGTPSYVCTQPLECFSGYGHCKPQPFALDVNYFRDWRCCEAKPPPAWKPPFAGWATNQHL